MRVLAPFVSVWAVVATAALAPAADTTPADPAALEFFENKVRPVLAEHCFSCHGPDKQKGGLRLDSAGSMRTGGDSGPVVVPGDPDHSRMIQAVRQEGELKMPPKGKLTAAEVEALAAWVKLGAPWPKVDRGQRTEDRGQTDDPAKTHWAFQPVRQPPIPTPRGPQSATRNPIDAFILAKLEERGLTLSPPADRTTLLRRVTLDLTGLPPTPAEVDAFVNDPSPDAYGKVIDRLLASPHYGERWGRHWLDIARYADSKGYVFQEERRYPFAYTYRDYVIRAFNQDLPYDRFILEQLAADKLPLGADKHPLAAMGFLTLGRRFLNNVHDIIDDRMDVVTRGLLGLTVQCARCHDHKYDPIPQKDYYSLYGVFASSVEPRDLPLLETPRRTPEVIAFEKELAKREAEVEAYRRQRQQSVVSLSRAVMLAPGLGPFALRAVVAAGPHPAEALSGRQFNRLLTRADRNKIMDLQRKADAFRANSPAAPPRAMVLADTPRPVEPVVFVRGNPANRGPAVPRQFLSVLTGPDRKPFTDGSGRLELAKAIADPNNPLTARVLVNRVWGWHFGKGLVATPSDFGLRSDPPTHPELLDWLADRFVRDGWSVKKLHKLILLSDAYCQRSDDRPECVQMDPENRLVWKFNRQRLDLEALRDSLLAVSGRLDPAVGGPAVDILKQPFVPRRTVYGFIDRQNLPGLYRTFDFASPDTHAPQRYTTTVPQQALFLMNSPFAVQQAQALAARPEVAEVSQPELRIDALYRRLYGRSPQPEEAAMGLQFIAEAEASRGRQPPEKPETKLTPWEQYAQVLLLANEFAFVE